MADKKISALTGATTPLAGSEVLPIVQGGSTVKVSVANLTAGRTTAMSLLDVENSAGGGVLGTLKSNWSTTKISFEGDGSDGSGIINVSNLAGSSAYPFKVKANGTETFKVETNGDTKAVLGNFVVGTAGKGIDFSANTHAPGMTSELLTWYEEGTWTPTDASGAGLSFVAVSGNYTRIGNTVFLFGYVRYPVTATTNTARIGGLPFTANSADSVTQGAVTYSQVATVRSVGVAKSTAILDVYTLAGGVPTNADLSNTVLYFNSTYFV